MIASFRATLYAHLRHAVKYITHNTLRLYCGDLSRFYDDLDRHSIRYVILRWSEDVSLSNAPRRPRTADHDIDHLIADNQLKLVVRLAGRYHGPNKCDWYSVTGQRGSAYKRMPYYPPAIAAQILASRRKDARGLWRPGPLEEMHSFAYHLCYHKGHRCGIATGFVGVEPGVSNRDYEAELLRLARVAGITLPEPLTLLSLHQYLQSARWGMAMDLMLRWPDQHRVLKAFQDYEESARALDIAAAKDLTLFILRDDCTPSENEETVRRMVGERFTILEDIQLLPEAQQRVVNQTRGGNWVEKYRQDIVWPTVALICRNAETPGPLPIRMSQNKLASRYPHVQNTDVLIKRVIREKVKASARPKQHRVVLHATDNATEAAEMLHAVLGPDYAAFFRRHPAKAAAVRT